MSESKLETVVGACPLDCPDACSWVATLENGIATRLNGNRDHPFTGAALCNKVNPYLEYCARPDRITEPLRRVGDKGAGRFETATWDEVLEEIAARLRAIIDEHGGEAIWPFLGTGTIGYLQGIVGAGKRLFHFLGASRHDANICSAAGYPGLGYVSGRSPSMDPSDCVHSGVVLIWGANTLSTNQHLWPFINRARKNGAVIVVVDPIRTRTAARADHHLAPMPGTDAALALGLMAEIDRKGGSDRAFLDGAALGWSEFRDQHLRQWSIEKTASVCGLDEGAIETVAELIARRRPLSIRLGMGMQRHAGGGQATRVIACLPAVTGDYRRLGGGLCYSTSPVYTFNTAGLNRPDLSPTPTRELAMTRLGHGLLELDPPIKALFVVAANPVASNPDQNRVRAGLSRDDLFVVSIENFLTDTTDYADFVLPSTMQTEHLDFHDSVTHLCVNWNQPFAEPPGSCLPHTEIFRRLARALDIDDPAVLASDLELARAAFTGAGPEVDGIDFDAMRERGWARLAVRQPFQPYAERFDTPSGKFEFESESADRDGHGRFPNYRPPVEATSDDDEHPFALVAAANHYLMNTMFADSTGRRRAGPPTIAIHPSDAARFGLESETAVRVHNRRGEFAATLVVSDEARPGTAAMTKGHWPKLSGGSTVNATTREFDADMARGAVFHDNRVAITATEPG